MQREAKRLKLLPFNDLPPEAWALVARDFHAVDKQRIRSVCWAAHSGIVIDDNDRDIVKWFFMRNPAFWTDFFARVVYYLLCDRWAFRKLEIQVFDRATHRWIFAVQPSYLTVTEIGHVFRHGTRQLIEWYGELLRDYYIDCEPGRHQAVEHLVVHNFRQYSLRQIQQWLEERNYILWPKYF